MATDLISITEAASALGIHRSTVHRAIKDGRIKAIKRGGTRWRVLKDSLMDFSLGKVQGNEDDPDYLTHSELEDVKAALEEMQVGKFKRFDNLEDLEKDLGV
ncbi:MAG: helix-turn-helix domain-containing protein [Myxococcota bacterium]|nr:helix-turn-helix domain-containing protein [Myxococcota bacterium]